MLFAGPWKCPKCGWSPELVDGFPLLAQHAVLRDSVDYPTEAYERLFALEATNFWFQYRFDLIRWALVEFFPHTGSFLELGCGTGFVLKGLNHAMPDLMLHGGDIHASGLQFAKSRLPEVAFLQMNAMHIPYGEEFDVVGAFDVIEHLDNDVQALRQISKCLKRGAGVVLTVQQHSRLWSAHDRLGGHKRRYRSAELRQKLADTGFEIVHLTSFITLLLPLLLARKFKLTSRSGRTTLTTVLDDLSLPKWINACLGKICSLESRLIVRGLSLPFGGSILCIARKD